VVVSISGPRRKGGETGRTRQLVGREDEVRGKNRCFSWWGRGKSGDRTLRWADVISSNRECCKKQNLRGFQTEKKRESKNAQRITKTQGGIKFDPVGSGKFVTNQSTSKRLAKTNLVRGGRIVARQATGI